MVSGQRVKVTAGSRVFQSEARCPTSYVFQNDTRLHFGLGQVSKVDRVEIRWPKPGGQIQVLTNIPVDQLVHIQNRSFCLCGKNIFQTGQEPSL